MGARSELVRALTALCVGRWRVVVGRQLPWLDKPLDDELSNRWLDLDPMGYFIIKLDRDQRLIVADHYTNTINKNGALVGFIADKRAMATVPRLVKVAERGLEGGPQI